MEAGKNLLCFHWICFAYIDFFLYWIWIASKNIVAEEDLALAFKLEETAKKMKRQLGNNIWGEDEAMVKEIGFYLF